MVQPQRKGGNITLGDLFDRSLAGVGVFLQQIGVKEDIDQLSYVKLGKTSEKVSQLRRIEAR